MSKPKNNPTGSWLLKKDLKLSHFNKYKLSMN
jgi:hypothetical protein